MIHWIAPDDNESLFPDVETALTEPDGLLAAGGNLHPERLLHAYRRGIFPWYSPGEPILWWSPSNRAVIFPEKLHISRSLRKVLNKRTFTVTRNTAFAEIIHGCAAPRAKSLGTWLDADMIAAYNKLHTLGYAHSVECWLKGELAGGIYGVQLGKVFFGESMFSLAPNASKVALVTLVTQTDIALLDCQIPNEHLASLGMTTIARGEFIKLLGLYCSAD
jgi:leucyl/phenylalanyl-tRNA--protein transferase